MRVVVLGATGMLGSEVVRICKLSDFETIEVSRTGNIVFDFPSESFGDLSCRLDLGTDDFVVNCIGWIPQRSSGDNSTDQFLAMHLNVELPRQIDRSARKRGFQWIQIATDCVFSGISGSYMEDSPKDAEDLYGLTKIAGELESTTAMQIRASIIGPDNLRNAGLYAWFKSAIDSDGKVIGFTNQIWNGVSTTAFARLVVGLVMTAARDSFALHWSPSDAVSKFELLNLFAKHLALPPDSVEPGLAAVSGNRTLTTKFPSRNLELWSLAGYERVPTIEELVAELVESDIARECRE